MVKKIFVMVGVMLLVVFSISFVKNFVDKKSSTDVTTEEHTIENDSIV